MISPPSGENWFDSSVEQFSSAGRKIYFSPQRGGKFSPPKGGRKLFPLWLLLLCWVESRVFVALLSFYFLFPPLKCSETKTGNRRWGITPFRILTSFGGGSFHLFSKGFDFFSPRRGEKNLCRAVFFLPLFEGRKELSLREKDLFPSRGDECRKCMESRMRFLSLTNTDEQ